MKIMMKTQKMQVMEMVNSYFFMLNPWHIFLPKWLTTNVKKSKRNFPHFTVITALKSKSLPPNAPTTGCIFPFMQIFQTWRWNVKRTKRSPAVSSPSNSIWQVNVFSCPIHDPSSITGSLSCIVDLRHLLYSPQGEHGGGRRCGRVWFRIKKTQPCLNAMVPF